MANADTLLTLVIIDPQGRRTEAHFGAGTFLIGRGETCAIRFPDASVSRRHAQLVVRPGSVRLEDLDSKTGTMVNGRVIRTRELESNDIIAIQKTTMVVHLPESQQAVVPAVVLRNRPATEDVRAAAETLGSELDALRNATERLMTEVGRRIIGQKEILRAVWATILARGHCLLVGVPGLAKTSIVTSFAEALGLQTKRIQFTPDLMPADIIGSNLLRESEDQGRYLEFAQGPVFTQLLLADEINRTPPKTQAALLEAMQERQVTVGDRSLSLPDPFCVIATQNPIEQEGTYPLPEAQQDRFMLCVYLDYPSRDDEVEILFHTTHGSIAEIGAALDSHEVIRFQDLVNRIAVPRETAEYAADLARYTRPGRAGSADWVKKMIDWGAGPRAGQSLIRSAKALAAMDGRPAISRDDIKEMAVPALRHRISCNFRARSEGMDENKVVERVIEEVRQDK